MNAFEFKPAHGLDAKSLSSLLIDELRRFGLDLAYLVTIFRWCLCYEWNS